MDRNRIEELLSYLWLVLESSSDAVDENRINETVSELLETVPYPITVMPPYIYNFYRVRQGERDQFYNNKREFCLPPNPEKISQGRCNRNGTQALYFAVTEHTALYEACHTRRSKLYDFHLAYISRWVNCKPVRIAKFLDIRAPLRDRHAKEKHSADMLLMARLHPDMIDLIRKLLHVVGRCFSTKVNDSKHVYIITNAVTDCVFKKFDGIYYSSAMRDSFGSNAALKPELLDSSFEFQAVARVLYAPLDKRGENFAPLNNSLGKIVAPDGTLEWRENAGIFSSRLSSKFIEENYRIPW